MTSTAIIHESYRCKDCGWPVVDACCNDSFCDFKDAAKWDRWYYCSNKGCKNHDGEGVAQNHINWIMTYNKKKEDKPNSWTQIKDGCKMPEFDALVALTVKNDCNELHVILGFWRVSDKRFYTLDDTRLESYGLTAIAWQPPPPPFENKT